MAENPGPGHPRKLSRRLRLPQETATRDPGRYPVLPVRFPRNRQVYPRIPPERPIHPGRCSRMKDRSDRHGQRVPADTQQERSAPA